MEEKDSKVYVPLLNAFEAEIKNAYLKDKNLPKKLVEYLLGEYDFYKVISVDSQQMTQLQTYNMHGTLNKTAKKQKPKKIVPISTLPTDKSIDNIGFWKRKAGIFREKAGFIGNIMQRACTISDKYKGF